MITIQLELEDDLVALMGRADQSIPTAAKELIVLELYRRGTISGGKAAEVLGMRKIDFIQHSGKLGIPYFNMTPEELDDEVKRLREML